MNQHLVLPTAPYDPAYDPVSDAGPGAGRAYCPTYWIGTAGPAPEDDGPVTADTDVDVAIVAFGLLGDAEINVGSMQVARSERRDVALMVMTVDSELAHEVAARIAEAINAEHFAVVNL